MTVIRAIFDGKTFVPQEPITLATQAEALVLVESADQGAQQKLDEAVRAYYQGAGDAEDDLWASAAGPELHRAWDED
jgi:hypothetical protein